MVAQIQLIGNVGKDPEFSNITDGIVARFSLATTSKEKGEQVTDWWNITVFGKLADIVEKYVNKGDKLFIQGRIKRETFTTKEGEKREVYKVTAEKIEMLGSKKDKEDDQSPSRSGSTGRVRAADVNKREKEQRSSTPTPVDLDDDIPF